MPGEVSRSNPGPSDESPYCPDYCYPNGPRMCPCGHHEGYHNDQGECLLAHQCQCKGLPLTCRTPTPNEEGQGIREIQQRIGDWVRSTLGEKSLNNPLERCLRLMEEAAELSQAVGVNAETLHRLIDYVYARPKGKAPQEIAGCMVTICAAAFSLKVDLLAVTLKEIRRIHTSEVIARVRRRQHEKREAGLEGKGLKGTGR